MMEIIAIVVILITVIILALMFEVFIYYTGEVVLYALTLGRRQPRWDFMAYEKGSKYIINRDLSTIIGIFFWVVFIAFFAFLIAGI